MADIDSAEEEEEDGEPAQVFFFTIFLLAEHFYVYVVTN